MSYLDKQKFFILEKDSTFSTNGSFNLKLDSSNFNNGRFYKNINYFSRTTGTFLLLDGILMSSKDLKIGTYLSINNLPYKINGKNQLQTKMLKSQFKYDLIFQNNISILQ